MAHLSICELSVKRRKDFVDVRWNDEHSDRHAVALASLNSGATVLLEEPVVFCPSSASVSALGFHKTCATCGRVLLTVAEDVDRCQHLFPSEALSCNFQLLSIETMQNRNYVEHRSAVGCLLRSNRWLWFCNDSCQHIGLTHLGYAFWLDDATEPQLCVNEVAKPDVDLPSSTCIAEDPSSIPLPTLRSELVEYLLQLAEVYNERIALLLRFVSRALASWVSGLQRDKRSFDELVCSIVEDYAEGAARSLNHEQRALLRLAHRVLNAWLQTVTPPPGAPEASLALQTILRVLWAFDANCHTYIVVCPLYQLADKLRSREAIRLAAQARDPSAFANVVPFSSASAESDGRDALTRLRCFFAQADPALLHCTGVALYHKATKFNHSCAPNVKFLPTADAVYAHVVALSRVERGAELLTSYIDTVAMNDPQTRREYLTRNYGFTCLCPRCLGEVEALR